MDVISNTLNHIWFEISPGVEFELKRYAIGTLSTFLVIWVLLGRALESRKIRKPTPRARQIRRELTNSFLTVFVFVLLDAVIFDLSGFNILRKYDDIADYGWAYYWLSIPLMIVLHDAYFYWTHRMMHHPKLYCFFHMTHHRSHNPTPFTAYSFAPPEAVVNYLFVPLALMVVPLHTSALFIVLGVMIFKNAIGHCGYELMPRRWARLPVLGWMTSVTHHDMHHERANGNYGFYFTWWDRWMGTEHPDYLERFESVGRRNRSGAPEPIAVAAE
ncbi:MAG: sterol desaturase family protein [Pseudomonadota bacterium]